MKNLMLLVFSFFVLICQAKEWLPGYKILQRIQDSTVEKSKSRITGVVLGTLAKDIIKE